MRKVTSKRFFALILAVILCFGVSTPVSASAGTPDVAAVTAAGDEGVMPTSLGSCLDSGTEFISGYGTLTLHLSQSYNGLYFRAMATGNSNVAVDCTLILPTGSRVHLGTLIADGEATPYLRVSGTMPAGNYIFEYTCSSMDRVACIGLIYSNFT